MTSPSIRIFLKSKFHFIATTFGGRLLLLLFLFLFPQISRSATGLIRTTRKYETHLFEFIKVVLTTVIFSNFMPISFEFAAVVMTDQSDGEIFGRVVVSEEVLSQIGNVGDGGEKVRAFHEYESNTCKRHM